MLHRILVVCGLLVFVAFGVRQWRADQSLLLNASKPDSSQTKSSLPSESECAPQNNSLPSFMVQKTHFSSKLRFVFIAALGGTGHHGWQELLIGGKVCQNSISIQGALKELWWGDDKFADSYADTLEHALEQTARAMDSNTGNDDSDEMVICFGTVYSYPFKNSKTHHPNVWNLARIAEQAGVDLRIIVLHRHPANQLVSLSIHRNFLALPEEANQMANQGAMLNSQLHVIDPTFFVCVGYTDVVEARDALQYHVFGGMTNLDSKQLLSTAIAGHYHARADDPTAALKEIRQKMDGKEIQIKIDEMEAYYRYLKQELCPR